MQNQTITSRQAICILVMFVFGSTLVFDLGTEVKQDMWIAFLFTVAMTLPVVLIQARTAYLFPQKDLHEILDELFGRVMGKVFTAAFAWYAVHLGASVLRNFTDFIQIAAMPETPQLPVAILMVAVVVYLARCGTGVFGKWAVVTLAILYTIISITLAFSFGSIDWTHLLPVRDSEWKDILLAGYRHFSLPFGETVLLLGIAGSFKKGESPYKIYLYGTLAASVTGMIILLRNILVLGPSLMEAVYYPSFVAGKIINPTEFFARMESTIASSYLFTGVTKIALCVVVASKGIAGLLGLPSYKNMLIPVGLLCLALGMISYESVTQLFRFIKSYYTIYAIPFQLVLPLLIWLAAERKKARAQKPSGG
jgi:spore germination protein KB